MVVMKRLRHPPPTPRGEPMDSFRDRIAVVTGGGTGMGRELVRQLAAEGCHVATCDVSAEHMARDARREPRRRAAAGTRVTTHCRRRLRRGRRCSRFRDAVASGARDRQRPPAVQQRRHRRRRQPRSPTIAPSGSAPSTICWGGVYLLHARVPADAGGGRRGAHRQHQQRQRLLGLPRPRCSAHRLQRGQVRGEGLQRGADQRPARQRAARQGARS